MKGERLFYPEEIKREQNLLLEGPELISPGEERKLENRMVFSFSSPTRQYRFGYKDGKSFFIIEYFDSLPDGLSKEEKEKFAKETENEDEIEKTIYVLRHGEIPEPSQNKYYIAQPRDFEKFDTNDKNKQIVNEILTRHSELNSEEILQIVNQVFEPSREQDKEMIRSLLNKFSKENAEKIRDEIKEKILPKPQEMEIPQLVNILKNKKVLFYTGAGISMASGVSDMDQLQKMLGIEMLEKIDDLIKKAVTNPQSVIDLWEEFAKASFKNPPTSAHQSLGTLARKLKSQIFTENVDQLQEKTGVKAIHLTNSQSRENIQPEWLKDIDAVVAVGLSYDDRGFLGWYKENNPNGKIIAINLCQPSYLGNEDFILKGDCQKIIPELEKDFVAKEQNQ